MSERPILFSAPMVRAILDGRKQQTRRVVKPQDSVETHEDKSGVIDVIHLHSPRCPGYCDYACKFPCPYGAAGDRLWVRETWSKAKSCNAHDLFYRADGDRQYGKQHALSYVEREDRWRPSIHMPRWASRITLELTGVRVERLQDISDDDAKAEGVVRNEWSWDDGESPTTDREAFECVWVAINGRGSWDANPWVWVIDFRVTR
jgi:hypothetical protein